MTVKPVSVSADDVRIAKPRLRVVLEYPDSTGDELAQLDIQTDNRDAVRFDLMRARMNWPGGQDSPVLWMTVQAWSAIKRSKVEPWHSLAFDKFNELCVDLAAIDAEGNVIRKADQVEAMGVADPTPPAAEPV